MLLPRATVMIGMFRDIVIKYTLKIPPQNRQTEIDYLVALLLYPILYIVVKALVCHSVRRFTWLEVACL